MKMFSWQLLSSVVLTSMLIGFTSLDGAAVGRAPLTLSLTHTTKVKVHDREGVLLSCGENAHKSVVLYWHTPFGQLHNHISVPGNQDPVTMRPDGSLEINNTGEHHQGLYYCLLQGGEGTTLYSYQLRMESEEMSVRSLGRPQLGNSEVRQRRNTEGVGLDSPDGPREDAAVFAGAVAASVLLTFVLGFSVGALSSAPVLRCVRAATKVRSLRRRGRIDATGRGAGVVMDALPPAAWDNEAYQGPKEDCASVTAGSTSSTCPPAKPQRSFRRERAEQAETTTYLEGCDYTTGEKEGETRDGTGESKANGAEVEGDSKEGENEERRGGAGESKDNDVEDEDKGPSEPEEEAEGEAETGVSNSTGARDVEERKSEDEEGEGAGEEEKRTPPRAARRSRVIRLYQYDDEGQRYGHLPDPASAEPVPAPRLKQRSLSLTRLSAIMAAAGGGPLEPAAKENGREENDQEERLSTALPSSPGETPVFSMDI